MSSFKTDMPNPLRNSSIDNPEFEFKWLKQSAQNNAHLQNMVTRRLSGEPLQYILGEWEFFGLPLYVGKGVLNPRPETELVVEIALRILREGGFDNVVDLCSGSGSVALAIAAHANKPLGDGDESMVPVTAVELSKQAYAYLTRNAARHGGRVVCVNADMFEFSIPPNTVITVNPPYLSQNDMANLQTEVAHEPEQALYGGEDGLEYYRRIASEIMPCLRHCAVIAEIGDTQGDAVRALLSEYNTEIIRDYSGRCRVAFCRVP